MGVIAYYLDNKKWENQLSLIGLRHLYSSYLGENMASVLIKLTKKYEITDRLGFFTLDNAEFNNIYFRIFLYYVFFNFTNQDITERRLRYIKHVLTLVVKKFFFGDNIDVFEIKYII